MLMIDLRVGRLVVASRGDRIRQDCAADNYQIGGKILIIC